MASGLVGSFPRASSIATGSYASRALLWNKTRKLSSKEYRVVRSPQHNLKHHFKSIEVLFNRDKCERKYFINATSSEEYESQLVAPASKSISEFIKDLVDLSVTLGRPYVFISSILDTISSSILAVESLSDLSSPAFFIGLLQYIVPLLFMLVYQGALNELADIEIDKINKPHYPLASGKYTSNNVIIVGALSLFMCGGIGWIVGSWPLRWALFAGFMFGNAYSCNLPLMKWKRFTSLAVLCTLSQSWILCGAGSFLHMKTHVLHSEAIYPTRSIIFSLMMRASLCIVMTLIKDIPDIEGDRAGGIQTLAVRLGADRVLWLSFSLLEMSYGAAIIVGATSPFLWSKIIMVSAHAIMALILWYKTKSVNLKNRAGMHSYYMTIFKLHWAESIITAVAR